MSGAAGTRRRGLWSLLGLALAMGFVLHMASPSAVETVYCPEDKSPADGKVVMLATDWCPYCAKARHWLQQHKVDYCEYDVDHSRIGQALHARSGASGIPVLFIGEEIIPGYDPEAMEDALEARQQSQPGGVVSTRWRPGR